MATFVLTNEPEAAYTVGLGEMRVIKQCPFTRKFYATELPIQPEQWNKWQGGELIQYAMPHLTVDEREFLISGITPEVWAKYIKE